jgi:hypothetical protein
VEAYAIGQQYYSVRRNAFDEDTTWLPATPSMPRAGLGFNLASLLRAFPGVAPETIGGAGGALDVRSGGHTVSMIWVRHAPGPLAKLPPRNTLSLSDMLLHSQRSWEFTDTERYLAWSNRQVLLGTMALEVAPTVFDTASTTEPFLWLLVGNYRRIAHFAVGRVGMDANLARLATQITRARIATGSISETPPDVCSAIRTKFGAIDPKDAPSACGVDIVSNGPRHVTVIWGFADVSR